jgi:hypothetical protein
MGIVKIVATGNETATDMEIGNETETETAGIGIVTGIEVVVGETTVTSKVVDHRDMMTTGATTGAEETRIPLNLGRMDLLVRGGEGAKPRTVLLSEGLRLRRE